MAKNNKLIINFCCNSSPRHLQRPLVQIKTGSGCTVYHQASCPSLYICSLCKILQPKSEIIFSKLKPTVSSYNRNKNKCPEVVKEVLATESGKPW